MKTWQQVVGKLNGGKSLGEATKEIPLATKLIRKRFSQNHISTKQRAAIKRG